MHCKMPPAPPAVHSELERLFAEWRATVNDDDIIDNTNDFDIYCEKHGSKALHDYDKKCAEIRVRLEPGEHV